MLSTGLALATSGCTAAAHDPLAGARVAATAAAEPSATFTPSASAAPAPNPTATAAATAAATATATATATTTPTASPQPTEAAHFPVKVAHDYGTATIPSEPKRIVALDAEEDTLAALGIAPLTYTPVRPGAGPAPWLAAELDLAGATPLDLGTGIDLAEVEALEPDLILRTRAYPASRDEYDRLRKIAPTVYFAFGDPWQQTSRAIGAALGRGPAVEAAIAAAEQEVAAAARPGLAGRTFALAYVFDRSGVAPLDATDPAARLLVALGMRIAPGLAKLGSATARTELTYRDTPRLDADLLAVGYADDAVADAFTATKAFRKLRAVRGNTYTRLDLTVLAQLRNPTLRGLPWALDQISAALDRAAALPDTTPTP